MKRYNSTLQTPIGTVYLEADEYSLRRISFSKNSESENENHILIEAKTQLIEYFEGKRKKFDLPLHAHGTIFQNKVWEALSEIPYGETRSYGEIAEFINNPKASRAVGLANNKNPFPIVVPCHRVIGSSGKLVGYASGLEIKKKLLQLERVE